MKSIRIASTVMGAAVVAALFTSVTSAETATGTSGKEPDAAGKASGVLFAKPVRIEAGGKFAGEARSYPSPVLHDVNGDGLADLVIGDLGGRLTVALREAGDGPVKFGAESPMKDWEGKDIKFNNW